MKTILGMTLAAVMAVSAVSPASAVPMVLPGHGDSLIVRVEGGCGDGRHRGGDGFCYRNFAFREGYGNGRPCPPGWHLGEGGRRCWRNY